MGQTVYGWIFDHWGGNAAGILTILFVILYLYAKTIGKLNYMKRNSTKSAMITNSQSSGTTSPHEITTTLSYLESSEKR
jgi:hypothetical protein